MKWLFCKHENVRCVHGDEIVHRRYRRVACLDCGRSLKRDLPSMCWFTGTIHEFDGRTVWPEWETES